MVLTVLLRRVRNEKVPKDLHRAVVYACCNHLHTLLLLLLYYFFLLYVCVTKSFLTKLSLKNPVSCV